LIFFEEVKASTSLAAVKTGPHHYAGGVSHRRDGVPVLVLGDGLGPSTVTLAPLELTILKVLSSENITFLP
jgi:hypothetical protein